MAGNTVIVKGAGRLLAALCIAALLALLSAQAAFADYQGASLIGDEWATAQDEAQPALGLDNATAAPGKMVDIDVSVAHNPGIMGATIEVTYDSGLVLTGITNGEAFQTLDMTKPGEMTTGCNIHWDAADVADDDIKDGTIATLTFLVPAGASVGDTFTIGVSATTTKGQPDVYDRNLELVNLVPAQCVITVVAGDSHTHVYNLWKTTADPTCTKAGSRERMCTVCGEKEIEAIEAFGHNWDSGQITKAATYDTEGRSTYTCLRCGETREEVIPALKRTSIKDATIGPVGPVIYTGSPLKPSPVITFGGKALTLGVDYSLEYSNNTNVGTATIAVVGQGGYTGVALSTFQIVNARPKGVRPFSGANRYDTARMIVDAELELGSYGGAIIVSGADGKFPDALSAAGLSGMLNYPLVMVNGSALSQENRDALAKLKAANGGRALDLVIVGGTSAVSKSTEKALGPYGKVIKRLDGKDRYDTNALIYEYGKSRGSWATADVFVATGDKFPDALAIAPYLVWSKSPIVLVRPQAASISDVPAKARGALANANRVIVLGGTVAVSDKMLSAAKATSRGGKQLRLSGAERYETGAAIASWELSNGMSIDGMGVATGQSFPDALSSGFLLGKTGSVLCLASPDTAVNDDLVKVLKAKSGQASSMCVFGGTSAVSNAVRSQITKAVGIA